MTPPTIWMNFKSILSGEEPVTFDYSRYLSFHLRQVPRVVKCMETEWRMVVTRGWWQLLFSGYIDSVLQDGVFSG